MKNTKKALLIMALVLVVAVVSTSNASAQTGYDAASSSVLAEWLAEQARIAAEQLAAAKAAAEVMAHTVWHVFFD